MYNLSSPILRVWQGIQGYGPRNCVFWVVAFLTCAFVYKIGYKGTCSYLCSSLPVDLTMYRFGIIYEIDPGAILNGWFLAMLIIQSQKSGLRNESRNL